MLRIPAEKLATTPLPFLGCFCYDASMGDAQEERTSPPRPNAGGGLTAVVIRMAHSSFNKGEEVLLTVILKVLRPLCRRMIVCNTAPNFVRSRHGVEVIRASQFNVVQIACTIGKADLVVWAGGHMVQDVSSRWSILVAELIHIATVRWLLSSLPERWLLK